MKGGGGAGLGLETTPPAHWAAQLWAEPAHHVRSLVQVHIWGKDSPSMNCRAVAMSPPHPTLALSQCHTSHICAALGLVSLSLPLPLLPAHNSCGTEFALFCVFSRRPKWAQITCPLSLRKRTRIRTRDHDSEGSRFIFWGGLDSRQARGR